MKYKRLCKRDLQSHEINYVLDSPNEMSYSASEKIENQYIITFKNIQSFYFNNEDQKALDCINLLKPDEIANDQNAFSFFENYNIASILLEYVSRKCDFKFNRIALLKIIDFTSSSDDRYINKFINLSICDIINDFLDEYKYLTPFAILELSYICQNQQSLDFYGLDFNFDNFFDLLSKSHGEHYSAFMESFKLLVHIYDPIIHTNEILNILKNIDKIIQELKIAELSLYGALLEYVLELANFDVFFELIDQAFIQNLINLMYRFGNPNDKDKTFLKYLLPLICLFSQETNCPEIQNAFLIYFYRNVEDLLVRSNILFIIGNICKNQYLNSQNSVQSELQINLSHSLAEEIIQKDFIKEILQIINRSYSYQKIEALICFSKIISFTQKSVFDAIIDSCDLDLTNIMESLIDSLRYFISDTNYDRLCAILKILEHAHLNLSYSDFIDFIEDVDISSIFEIEFQDDDEIEIIGEIEFFLEKNCNRDN